MKTIKVTRHTRRMIKEYMEDGETLDDTISRLIKSTKPLPKIERSVTNITIKDSTLEDLKRYKSYPTQSHNNAIMELLKQVL